jgi:hypothetical protein
MYTQDRRFEDVFNQQYEEASQNPLHKFRQSNRNKKYVTQGVI